MNFSKLIQVRIKRTKNDKQGKAVCTYIDGSRVTPIEKHICVNFQNKIRTHVCLGAKGLSEKDGRKDVNFYALVLKDINSYTSALNLLIELEEYYKSTDDDDLVMKTCAVAFFQKSVSREEYEEIFWSYIQKLHDLERVLFSWPEGYSLHPRSGDFEFCLAGRPVFPVALGWMQERTSRDFSYACWAVNQISQFETLREKGEFENWQKKIRTADATLDRSRVANPNLDLPNIDQISGFPAPTEPYTVRQSFSDISDAYNSCRAALLSESCPQEFIDRFDKAFEARIKPNL